MRHDRKKSESDRNTRSIRIPNDGKRRNPVANVPAILPRVLIAPRCPICFPLEEISVIRSRVVYGGIIPRKILVGANKMIEARIDPIRASRVHVVSISSMGAWIMSVTLIAMVLKSKIEEIP